MAFQAIEHEWPSGSDILPHWRRGRMIAGIWVWLALAGWVAASAVAFAAVSEHRRADQAAQMAGLTPARGPGVEIVLTDGDGSPQPAGGGQRLITDADLIVLNMLLWYGGARAVEINDHRITAQSTITSSGPVMLINGEPVAEPFRIAAIGDPKTLRSVLNRGAILEEMRGSGVGVTISGRPDLRVPAWRPPRAATQ
jgi:uncharacterized protein YlxW (UPF0749 family)